MESLGLYLLKSAVWLTGFTLVFLMVLRNERYFRLNRIYLLSGIVASIVFSFFSFVFVNPSITDIETKEIVNHEREHIQQRHWFDLLLVELLCMLQWFNPFVWIYARLIRQNHEYLADEMALQNSSNPAIYQATLLNQLFDAPVIRLANSFNYSLNK